MADLFSQRFGIKEVADVTALTKVVEKAGSRTDVSLVEMTEDYVKDLIVVSYNEIEANIELQSVGMVTA